MAAISDLHLPDLSVKGFRGIKDLTISHLGRVTLFAGKNGVGKTTLLDAIRLYAARGSSAVLAGILRDREELTETAEEDGNERLTPNWDALFYGRHTSPEARISIGPIRKDYHLNIDIGPLSPNAVRQLERYSPDHPIDDEMQSLRVEFKGSKKEIPTLLPIPGRRSRMFWDDESESQSPIRYESLGPGLLSNDRLARSWDKVALTEDEVQAVQVLNLIFDDNVVRVAVIGDERSRYGRRIVAKIKGQDRPVPLKSLGDGAVRLFGVALALANSQDGFLLIDEVENGIHHSIQPDFWKMVLKTAQMNKVQVLATTHGWDCVAGFARAAMDLDEVEGILVRLEQDGEKIRAIEYSENDLNIAAEQGIEVR